MDIKNTIKSYYDPIKLVDHHRYCSWEHCYKYFRQLSSDNIATERDHAALQLGFYLASWGMYRGSSFLLQNAYTVHRGVIDLLVEERFKPLWDQEFGIGGDNKEIMSIIMDAVEAIRFAYHTFAPNNRSRQPTDTLVTKIILGTFGCLPACDRYFIDGLKTSGLSFSCLNQQFFQLISKFCCNHLGELLEEQKIIETERGIRYPLMKLVDMYFWQIGFDLNSRKVKLKDALVASL